MALVPTPSGPRRNLSPLPLSLLQQLTTAGLSYVFLDFARKAI